MRSCLRLRHVPGSLLVLLVLGGSLLTMNPAAGGQPQAALPHEPLGIALEGYPYPYPVQLLPSRFRLHSKTAAGGQPRHGWDMGAQLPSDAHPC
jgi:hypothetical protein